jgi:hypothetical protein
LPSALYLGDRHVDPDLQPVKLGRRARDTLRAHELDDQFEHGTFPWRHIITKTQCATGEMPMSLCITFRLGEDFYIGDQQWRVVAIYPAGGCRVREEPNGARFDVNARAVEIAQGVRLATGPRHSASVVCLAIEAPRETRVLRGRKYRAGASP